LRMVPQACRPDLAAASGRAERRRSQDERLEGNADARQGHESDP
jgi:hypothetical protein